MRTTSTVEAYNSVLADGIAIKGHFFKFVHDLRSEEHYKFGEATKLINSGGATAKRRKVEWVVGSFFSHFFYFPFCDVLLIMCFIFS